MRHFGKVLFFFFGRAVACGILVLRPGIEPAPPALEVQSPNHWTAREVLVNFLKRMRETTKLSQASKRYWAMLNTQTRLEIMNLKQS